MVDVSRSERVLGPLRVGLRRDLHFNRQRTRGGVRYVVHDPVTFKNHAFRTEDYRVLTMIVRQRTLGETLRQLIDSGQLRDDEADRQHFYKFVLWLHGIGLLHLPITGGSGAFERQQQARQRAKGPWYRLLISHRIPAWNPDAFLQRTQRYVSWLFGTPGMLLWLALMSLVAWKCMGRFDEMFAESTQLLSLRNLPILWAALVGLKVLHEFGHAYASRRYGASVPEMGVQMIMMTPCAYVDAGASWQLPRARQRVVVGLAGVYVESFVAAAAALVWAGTNEGFAHDVALNIVALASVVTVLFNINPLMKYDGYYVFSDMVGVYNLQQRAQRYLSGWANWLALGRARPNDRFSLSEKLIYGGYGPAAFVYRVLLAFTLTAVMMLKWPSAGLFLGAVFGWAMVLRPLLGILNYLWSSTQTAGYRTRGRLTALAMVTLVPLLGGLLPVSISITAPGVLDPLARQSVRAPVGGFVDALEVANGDGVAAGSTLCRLSNPELELRRVRLTGELAAELEDFDAIELDDPTQASIHRSRISYLRASVAEIDRRLESMTITARVDGTVASPNHDRLSGHFLQQGEELFQIHSGHRHIRVVLTEEEVARAQLEIGSEAEVRWTCDPSTSVCAVVREIHASASRYELPPELTMAAGGDVYVRPTAGSLLAADQPYLHVMLDVDSVPLMQRGSGLTARVRLPARLQLLGNLLQHRFLSFLNAWRMS